VAKITKQALEAPDPVATTTAEADTEDEAETPADEDEDEIATLPPATQPADEP
jgi:hypothetical protein